PPPRRSCPPRRSSDLSQHMDPKRSRNVSVGSTWDEDAEREVHSLIPGPGLHLIRWNKRFWLVNREVEKPGDKENSWLIKRNETLDRKSTRLNSSHVKT